MKKLFRFFIGLHIVLIIVNLFVALIHIPYSNITLIVIIVAPILCYLYYRLYNYVGSSWEKIGLVKKLLIVGLAIPELIYIFFMLAIILSGLFLLGYSSSVGDGGVKRYGQWRQGTEDAVKDGVSRALKEHGL